MKNTKSISIVILLLAIGVSIAWGINKKYNISEAITEGVAIEDYQPKTIDATEESAQENIADKENFDEFFSHFMYDTAFQLERVVFPLEFVHLDYENDYEVVSTAIKKADWAHQRFYANQQAYPALYNNYDMKLEDTNERLFAWRGVDNGIYTAYYFKRIEGKWYLTKWEDLST